MNSLEREVLTIIGENTTTPDVFTDTAAGLALVRGSINEAIQELLMVKGSYRRTYYLSLFEDRSVYKMSWATDYFGYVMQAWDRDRRYRLKQTDLLGLTAIDNYFLKHSGDPTHYVHIGYDSLLIYRKPSASGKILELDCVCIPKAYTQDTDPVIMRANFERACVSYAVSEYYASRGDANRATAYFQEYLETGQMKQLAPVQPERQYQFHTNNGGAQT